MILLRCRRFKSVRPPSAPFLGSGECYEAVLRLRIRTLFRFTTVDWVVTSKDRIPLIPLAPGEGIPHH